MLYTGFDGKGYQSALAVSDDLLHWKHKAVILKRHMESDRWDPHRRAATWMIKESDSPGRFPAEEGGRQILDGLITPTPAPVTRAVRRKSALPGHRMRSCWTGISRTNRFSPGETGR